MSIEMTKPMLSCIGVSKTFNRMIVPTVMLQDRVLRWRKHRERWSIQALKDISFDVAPGEWIGLYGPNGSGKTTLMRILGGLMLPDSGTVQVEGRVCSLSAFGTGFHMERTAEENIYFHGLLHGIPRNKVRESTDHIIEFAGVESHRDLPLKCYSTGMRARLAFAAASQIDSEIYLLDEVLAVGDFAFQQKCWGYFDEMRKAGKTVVLVSHEEGHLKRFCDRVYYLEQGAMQRVWEVPPPVAATVSSNLELVLA